MKYLWVLLLMLTPSICFGYVSSFHSFSSSHSSYSFHENLVTSPTHAWFPGNIYHNVLYGHHSNRVGELHGYLMDQNSLLIFLVVVALVLIFLTIFIGGGV